MLVMRVCLLSPVPPAVLRALPQGAAARRWAPAGREKGEGGQGAQAGKRWRESALEVVAT